MDEKTTGRAGPTTDPFYRAAKRQPFRVGGDGLVSRTFYMEKDVYVAVLPKEPQPYKLYSVMMIISNLASGFVGGLVTVRNGEGDVLDRFFSAKLTTDYTTHGCEIKFGRFNAISPAGGTAKFWASDQHILFGSLPELIILPSYEVELTLLDPTAAVPEVIEDLEEEPPVYGEAAVPGTTWTKTILALEPLPG